MPAAASCVFTVLVALALVVASADRLAGEPCDISAALFGELGDDPDFEDFLSLIVGSPGPGPEDWEGDPVAECGRPAAHALLDPLDLEDVAVVNRLISRCRALGLAQLYDIANDYLPEIFLDPRVSKASAFTKVISVLRRILPVRAARVMVKLDGADFADMLGSCLEARLQQMPWVGELWRLQYLELWGLNLKLGIPMLKVKNKRRLIAHIAASVLRDHTLTDRLLDELSRLSEAHVSFAGYVDECPESVRLELLHRSGKRSASILPEDRLQDTLLALSSSAISSMFATYFPTAVGCSGTRTMMAKRLARRLPIVVPAEVARELPNLTDIDLVGTLCHFLGAHLQRERRVNGLRIALMGS